MEIVLDSSAALTLCMPDERADAGALSSRIAGATLIVPVLWYFEVANALAVAVRRKRITQIDLDGVIEELTDLKVRISSSTPNVAALSARALESGLSVYDCAYLHLALELHIALATTDTRLKNVARGLNVSVINP